ncbi:general amino acid permease [Yamadazyma tenuis ATCC 10573]|uniref:General amino acid permease n=1 Tax=Candida tenuis (strain ATCC 10573 / BCRC 21748 / CBS 615 / JCM 9827 / NBRC 10315 / NRRL Y-1498 / VKM Y-70) TaxID=590646 RepID=G3B5T9_CANTC|nr:general amino acid permease [Yamadazyma tenuis ATCC 10573]EGV63301.1 general amino acid permease [Yamadazyma tenuis ATCC 10573]
MSGDLKVTSESDSSLVKVSNTLESSSQHDIPSMSWWGSFKDGFKPSPYCTTVDTTNLTDIERANKGVEQTVLNKDLKNRHLQMLSLGGTLGTGLLIGSGSALATGGPAALIIGWGIIGTMVFNTVHALGELCVALPVSGAFSSYATRFIDSSWGFAVGWNYALMWLIVLPLELVAAAISIQFWNSNINPVAWVSVFYILIVAINLFGVKGYGEAEFILSTFKVIALSGFIILGVILVCGGGPTHEFIGSRYWKDPGPFANGFKGVCSVFVTASYSLAGSELVGLAASESEDPSKTLPKAIRQVFWRIFFFFFITLTIVGLLVPYTSSNLFGSGSAVSPFVIAINNAHIKVLPSIFNAVILVSVISVGNSAVYGCSRTIQSLGAQGLAPKFCAYVDKRGRPLGGLLVAAVFGLLCFLSAYKDEESIFAWLLSISGLSTIFSWINIGVCHIRFRMALKLHGKTTDDLEFVSIGGIWGSIYSIVLLILVLIAQFWVALFPVGGDGSPNARIFFQNYLGVIVILVFYLAHKLYSKNWRLCVPLYSVKLD